MYQTIHTKLILFLCFFSSAVCAQSIERTATYSGGDFMSNDGSVSWTIGEPITETWTIGSEQLTQGFQQGVTTILALPVELLDFQAARLDFKFVLLNWQTISEQNNKGFFIERKTEKLSNFEIVGFVEGKGNSTELVDYEYLDENTFSGNSYYQLRQIDFDENESLSEIRMVEGIAIMPKVAIFPNPATDYCILTINAEYFETSKGNLSLFGEDGKKILEQSLLFQSNANEIPLSFVQQLNEGVYFITIQIGSIIQSLKLVIVDK